MAELRRSSAQGTGSRLVSIGECRSDGGAGQLWRGADAIKLTRRGRVPMLATAICEASPGFHQPRPTVRSGHCSLLRRRPTS